MKYYTFTVFHKTRESVRLNFILEPQRRVQIEKTW